MGERLEVKGSSARSAQGRQRLRAKPRCMQISPARKLPNPRREIIMAQPSPLSVLSGALKIADKFTVTMKRSATRFA